MRDQDGEPPPYSTVQGWPGAGVTPDSKPPSVIMFVVGQVRASSGEEVMKGTKVKRKGRNW